MALPRILAICITRCNALVEVCSLDLENMNTSVFSAWLRAVPEIILGGGGHRHFFVLWGEGVLLTTCPRSGGVTCPGGQDIFDP